MGGRSYLIIITHVDDDPGGDDDDDGDGVGVMCKSLSLCRVA